MSHIVSVGGGILDAPQCATNDINPTVKLVLTNTGKTVQQTIEYINQQSVSISIEKYVIMPNHLHLLVSVENGECNGASGMPPPTEGSCCGRANELIPKLVSSLKRYTNKQTGSELWQRTYMDHVIRDMRDYENHWEYIESNPLKWKLDQYYS